MVPMSQFPGIQLLCNEAGAGSETLCGCPCFSMADFQCTQTVLIGIVLICFFYAERCIGISFPAAAQIEYVENTADAVPA